ncbi:MAG: hypothetical protein R2762_18020 [Bryobacteraceae bacterium]
MFRIGIAILLLALGSSAADKAAAKTPARRSKTGSAAAARTAPRANVPLTIPKAAVEIEPGLWEHKDAKGKTWHYTRTPFGVRRFEPESIPDDSANEAAFLTAIDKGGDTVEFERKTPFGKAKWTRKRDELNDAEKLAVERARSGR